MFIKRNYLQPVFRSLFFARDSSKAWLRVRWWNDRLLSKMNKFLRSVAFRLWSAKYLIRFYFPSFPFKDTCKFYYYIFNIYIYQQIRLQKKEKRKIETKQGQDIVPFYPKRGTNRWELNRGESAREIARLRFQTYPRCTDGRGDPVDSHAVNELRGWFLG